MKKFLSFVFFGFVIIAFIFSGCSSDNGSAPSDPAPTNTPGVVGTATNTPIDTPTVSLTPSNMGGTINHASGLAGKTYVIFIDTDADPDNGYSQVYNNILGSGTSTGYDFYTGLSGTFYMYCVIDMDNSGDLTGGDYLGFANSGSPLLAPVSADVNVPNLAQNVTVAFVNYTVEINVTLPSVSNGNIYIGLYEDWSPNATPVNGWQGTSGLTTFTRTLVDVEPGTYYIGGWADANNDAGDMPTIGDFVAAYGATDMFTIPTSANFTVNSDKVINLNFLNVSNNVGGTVTVPSALSSAYNYSVILSTGPLGGPNQGGENVGGTTGSTPATGTTFDYGFFWPYPGTYYLTVMVDVDGNGLSGPPNSGDYAGIYGQTITSGMWSNWDLWPASPNASVPSIDRDVTCVVVPAP